MTIHSSNPFATEPDPVRRFRGRIGGAVSLWTTGAGAARAGLSVSSLIVANGDPGRVLGLLDPDASLTESLLLTGLGVVQLLEWADRDLADAFGGVSPAPGGPFTLAMPVGEAIPLVCDSPHSGVHYPADFNAAVPLARLRGGEDTHIDTLWSAVPRVGGTLIGATFPRVYIDPNRMLEDLDPELLASPWPLPLAPGEKTRLGYGLVWRRIDAATPIYDRQLSVAEVQNRIDRYYRPYHAALASAVEAAYERFGAMWHLNLHSMPNNAYERLKIESARPLADFVLGDEDRCFKRFP